MTKITQADTDAAESYYASGKMSVHHLAQAFANNRKIEITDAMLEAGAMVHYNRSHQQALRKKTVAEIFTAMMEAK